MLAMLLCSATSDLGRAAARCRVGDVGCLFNGASDWGSARAKSREGSVEGKLNSHVRSVGEERRGCRCRCGQRRAKSEGSGTSERFSLCAHTVTVVVPAGRRPSSTPCSPHSCTTLIATEGAGGVARMQVRNTALTPLSIREARPRSRLHDEQRPALTSRRF